MVIDTNVWISGLLSSSGAPAQVTRWVVRNSQPVFSAETFAELKGRLWRPKFDRYVTLEQRQRFLLDLESIAHWVEVPSAIAAKMLCRDPADDKFLHVALAAGAHCLITGDQDLLVLSETASALGVRILSPADAMGQSEFSP
ncbi:MAG: putative toxin-antitoxin system toxin component, PIN family [Azovibrio sp.]|nr:putative toxin-antitoxin system toxin component, PIN family [Azovibrio sp.]